MKSEGGYINLLGIIMGIITLAIVIISVVYLTRNRPFSKLSEYDFIEERVFTPWEDIEGQKRIDTKIETLEIKNFSGGIRIRTWDRNYTLIKYIIKGPFAEDLEVNIETSGSKLYIYPENIMKKRRVLASVFFDISITEKVKIIDVETLSGSIELSGMTAWIVQRLKTVSGSIETDNSGDLNISTTSGSVDFRFSGSKLYARTVSGSINGDILDLDESGGVNIASLSGSININASSDLNARVNLRSTSGSVYCGFPLDISIKKKNQLAGKIGEGSIPFKVKTTSGTIRLEKL